jgi:DNA-binding winged helix-turn-helix (wHTH) protein
MTQGLPAPSANYWADFPATYRAEQVATLASWIALGDSGVVVGASGSGKSNLAGFVANRRDVVGQYLAGQPDDYCFLHLDINSLPVVTTPNFYRGLLAVLQREVEQAHPELAAKLAEWTAKLIDVEDTLALYWVLQRAHALLVNRARKRVVWLIDRFDEACRRLESGTLSNLRSLRDQFKGRVSYIVFTRLPLARLRTPTEFDELHEILVTHTCWVGAMTLRDTHWIARQMAERHQTRFDEGSTAMLVEITGGWPALMKAACMALATGLLVPQEAMQTWIEHLLQQPVFQRICQEIWDDCCSAEQTVLRSLATGGDYRGLDAEILTYLEKTGLLLRHQVNARFQLISPIFAAFVKQQTYAPAKIRLDPHSDIVFQGHMPVELTALEHRLLCYFLAHERQICTKDILIAHVWPDEMDGMRDDSLAQLVRRLRDKIEFETATHTYLQTVHGRGYHFVQPQA